MTSRTRAIPDEADAPAVLARLLHQAEAVGASDVHLHRTPEGAQVSFRLDGLLTPVATFPPDLAQRLFGRIKYLARLKTYDDSLPQDGRIERADAGTAHDLRVATYPTVTGEKIVLRLFNPTAVRRLAELELPPAAVTALEAFLRGPTGLLLLTGPAGSGKTTTIYACLRYLLDLGGRHIITVEDPVEQILPGLMQTEVQEARGLTYAVAARHLLRQDPQVLVLGEIRDDATAGLAVRAALTGHLVISTLHAGSCRGVFERLLVMCPDASAVARAISLVLNQRLLRRLCRGCTGTGCSDCLHTGYRGRLPVAEWVWVDDPGRARLRAGELEALAPHPTLQEAARELWQQGLSDAREYERVFGHPPTP